MYIVYFVHVAFPQNYHINQLGNWWREIQPPYS